MVKNKWKQVALGDIALFQGGSQPPLSVFSSQKKEGYIRLVQIRDYKTDKYATYIPEKLAKRFCDKDDIMIGRYGPPIFQILRGIEGAYNVALIKAIPQGVNKLFLYYTLMREDLFEYIELLSRRTSGQTGVDLNNLRAYELSIPMQIEEQTAIAEALSDVDSLISSLQKLIEKKKAIKQGAMQELLTGKKRLPGFLGEWKKRKIGDFGDFISGNCFPILYQGVQHEEYPFYKVSDFNNLGNGHYMRKANNYISKETANLLVCRIFPKSSIIFAKIGAAVFLERKKLTTISCCIDNNMMAFLPNDTIFPEFMYYVFQDMRFGDFVETTALPSLSGKSISSIERAFPIILEEQQAIVQVLSDMDSEIERLEKKLIKYQQIKQGMMQELLTGRIRLMDVVNNEQLKTQIVQKKHPQPVHNQYFDDAVMIAGIVNAFYSEKYPLGRKKVQKLLYLVRRKEQVDISTFHKKAAGPYADEVRYKGGEPIAQKNRYIQVKRGNKGSCFEKGVKMQQALTYLQDWRKQADIDWLVSQFQYTGVNELELLATVDMAMCDLRQESKEISVASIKDLIRSNEEWRDKLKKTYFSDADIQRAIVQCQQLFPN